MKLTPAFAFVLAACTAQTPFAPLQPSAARQRSASAPLLYISDLGSFDVNVYSLDPLTRVRKLTGFSEPQGECSDASGDVWIADTGAAEMLEFRPGAKHAARTLVDPLGYPVGCAVDPASGDLAVNDIFSNNNGPGDVLVYHNARGTPAPYDNPHQYFYYFAAYDTSGNLYVSGMTKTNAYSLSALLHGAKTMVPVSVAGGTLHFPGSVFFNGETLVLGDQQCGGAKRSCLYEASVSGTRVTIAKSIALTGSCDVAQVALDGDRIYGGDYDSCAKGSSVTRGPSPPAASR